MERTLNRNIKKYRLLGKKDGIEYCRSSAAFAAHVGINPKTYKNYEISARAPSYDNLIKIASALGVSIDRLLGYDPPAENEIRFFLDDLGISFRTQVSDLGIKEYILSLPAKIKDDVLTIERMHLDTDAAEVKIYVSPVLRRKYQWFSRGKIAFREGDFEEIADIFSEHEHKLKNLAKYPFTRQLLFLGLVKAYDDQDVAAPDEEINAEYSSIFSFLLDLETFMDDILKEKEDWGSNDYWQLQDKMNDSLKTEQLREIFLDMLDGLFKNNGRGGVKIIRQRIQNKK